MRAVPSPGAGLLRAPVHSLQVPQGLPRRPSQRLSESRSSSINLTVLSGSPLTTCVPPARCRPILGWAERASSFPSSTRRRSDEAPFDQGPVGHGTHETVGDPSSSMGGCHPHAHQLAPTWFFRWGGEYAGNGHRLVSVEGDEPLTGCRTVLPSHLVEGALPFVARGEGVRGIGQCPQSNVPDGPPVIDTQRGDPGHRPSVPIGQCAHRRQRATSECGGGWAAPVRPCAQGRPPWTGFGVSREG